MGTVYIIDNPLPLDRCGRVYNDIHFKIIHTFRSGEFCKSISFSYMPQNIITHTFVLFQGIACCRQETSNPRTEVDTAPCCLFKEDNLNQLRAYHLSLNFSRASIVRVWCLRGQKDIMVARCRKIRCSKMEYLDEGRIKSVSLNISTGSTQRQNVVAWILVRMRNSPFITDRLQHRRNVIKALIQCHIIVHYRKFYMITSNITCCMSNLSIGELLTDDRGLAVPEQNYIRLIYRIQTSNHRIILAMSASLTHWNTQGVHISSVGMYVYLYDLQGIL